MKRFSEQYASVSPENFRDFKETEKLPGGADRSGRRFRTRRTRQTLLRSRRNSDTNCRLSLPNWFATILPLVSDPVGASARLAANYGSPVTEAQQRTYQQKQAAEQHRVQDSANVHKALDLIVQHNVLPGFEDEAVANAVADVLENKAFQRTGNRLRI